MTAKINSNVVMRKMSEHTMDNTILLRRTGKAEEIANTALFLGAVHPGRVTVSRPVGGKSCSMASDLGCCRQKILLSPQKVLRTTGNIGDSWSMP
jgi:hypothetical protein